MLYSIVFLLCAITLSGMNAALQKLGRLQTKEELKALGLNFLPKLYKTILPGQEWKALSFSLNFARLAFYLVFALRAFHYLITMQLLESPAKSLDALIPSIGAPLIFWQALVLILLILFIEVFILLLAAGKPQFWFKALSLPASFLLLLTLPITFCLFKLSTMFQIQDIHTLPSSFRVHEKILELLQESELDAYLEKNEKKLLYSVMTFKDRIAREIMVPRINVFSLSSDTTMEEAAQSFLQEGYSRIPIYKDSVDKIIGVLLYKDVLSLYSTLSTQKETSSIQKTIEPLVKPVLYTPETKKIASLLQEFRQKQIHIAIVVDEYGGTEGILTIEDILEELVGEIADEYDIQEAKLFSSLPSGGWVIDAKMNIIDIEEEIGIKIPHSPEYDTIGGYIFHKAGSIPTKGWCIHHDNFDLEVLSSDERSIDKIKITPHALKSKTQ